MKQLYTGSETCATPIAAINVNLGFEPTYVRVWNPRTGVEMIWSKERPTVTKKIADMVDGLIKTPAVSAATSDSTKIKVGAHSIQVNGVKYPITGNIVTKSDKDFPKSKWGVYGVQTGANGTVDPGPVGNTAGYATEALAIAAVKAGSVTSDHVLAGYVTVLASTSAAFEGTDAFDGSEASEVNYYGAPTLHEVESNGIDLIEVGDSSTIYAGFSIGADSDLQVAGDELYWEAAR